MAFRQIETVKNRAKGSTGEARFKEFKGISSIDSLGKLSIYNEENEINMILSIFSKLDESERLKAGILAAENPGKLLAYLNEHDSDLLHTFGKGNLNEDIFNSDLYIDLLEKVSPVYNAHNKLVNVLSENGPVTVVFNKKNFLPRIFQDKSIKDTDIEEIKATEEYQNLATSNQMTADEEAQLKNYLQNIDLNNRNSSYAPENYVHPGYGPITFWDKRELIVSNKDVAPDGLAMPATKTLTLMYALTIEDAVVFVDPNTELDEKVNNRTITKEEWQQLMWNKRFKRRRDNGVDDFWKQERERLLKGEATRVWTVKQGKDIINGKAPKYEGKTVIGHHTYSASKYPQIANKGEIIYPVTFREHLYRWHGGSYKKSLPGKPLNDSVDHEF